MELVGIVSVAAITVICYLAAMGLRNVEKLTKWLPFLCGLIGGVLGFFGMTVIPDFPASEPFTAIAVGIVSGLAATGINQGARQLSGYYDNK